MGIPNDVVGKVRLEFTQQGLDKLKADIVKAQQQLVSAEAAIQTSKAKLNAAIAKQAEAETKLNAVKAASASVNAKVLEAENKLEQAKLKQVQTTQAVEKAHKALMSAIGSGTATQTQTELLTTKLEIAQARQSASAIKAAQAVLNLSAAQAKATAYTVAEANASAKVTTAQGNVVASTAKVTNATTGLNAAQTKLSGLQGTLANAVLKVAGAKDKVANSGNKATQSTSQFNAALAKNNLNNFTRSLEQATGGFLKFGATGTTAINIVTQGIASLNPLAAGLVATLGIVGSAGAALIGAIAGPMNEFVTVAKEVRTFMFATGADAESSSVFNIIAKSVGSSAQALAITLGTLQNGIFELNLTGEKAAKTAAKNIDDINNKLKNLDAKTAQDILKAYQDLNREVEQNNRGTTRARDNFDFEAGQDREDIIANQTSIRQELSDRIVEIQRTEKERIEDLDRDIGYTRIDIGEDIEDAKADQARREFEIQSDLTKALIKLDEDYNNRKLSLAEKYFNASPLLRPFFLEQLNNLAKQKEAEAAGLRTKSQIEEDELDRSSDLKIRKLEERLRREEEAYRISSERVRADADRNEAEANTNANRRLAEIDRQANQEIASNQRSLDQQLEDARLHEEELRRLTDERILEYRRNLEEAAADAADKTNEELARAVSATSDTPLGRALALLKLDPAELVKLPPEEQLFKVAEAINSFTGPEKGAIIQQIAGLFGPDSVDFFLALAQAGPDFETAVKNVKGFLPQLVLTGDEVKKAFDIQKEFGLIKQIPQALAVDLARDLVPTVEDVAARIRKWWVDPENQTKFKNFIDGAAKVLTTISQTILDLIEGKTTIREIILKVLGLDSDASNETLMRTLGQKLGGAVAGAIKFVNDNFRASDIQQLINTVSGVVVPEALKLGTAFGKGFTDAVKIEVSKVFGREARESFFQKMDDDFNAGVAVSFQAFSDKLNTLWQGISDSLNTSWENLNTALVTKLEALATQLVTFFSGLGAQLPTINLGNIFNGGPVVTPAPTGNNQTITPVVPEPISLGGGIPIIRPTASGKARAGSSFDEGTIKQIVFNGPVYLNGSNGKALLDDLNKQLLAKGVKG